MNPRTHVFSAAIETYQEAELPVIACAESDGQRFTEAWQGLGATAADTVVLANSQATLGTLPSRLKKFLQNVEPGDRVVFFYIGHLFDDAGENYLTVSDTQPDDLPSTSVPLRRVLSLLGESKAAQILLFLSPSHGSEAAVPRDFSISELAEFASGASRFAFLSNGRGESSFANLNSRHGLWSQAIFTALQGEAKSAFAHARTITAASLQAYLCDEVPRLLRASVNSGETQTPVAFGDSPADLIIADLEASPAQSSSRATIKDSRLVGVSQGRVKSLGGFTKFHKEPDSCSSRSAQFVEELGAQEIEDRTTEIFERVRTTFRYKRKDLFFDKGGAIKTPDFDVTVRLTQDPASPNMYILVNEVTVSRRPEIVRDASFLEVFSRYCNSVIIELDGSLDIAAKIDDLEDVDQLRSHLEYDAECTEFTLRIPGSGIGLHATPNRLKFTLSGRGDLTALIAGTQAAMSDLASAKVSLGLPDA